MPMQICLLYQLTYRVLDLNMDITDRRGGTVMGLSRAVLPDLRGSDPRLHLPGDGPAGRTPSSRALSGFFYFSYFYRSCNTFDLNSLWYWDLHFDPDPGPHLHLLCDG